MDTGHADEFETIMEAHWASVLRLGFRMTGDQNEAEEIAQHTFFLAYRAWASFERRSAVSTWLFRIAVNACKQHMIQRRRERLVPLDESTQPVTFDDGRLDLRELRDRIETGLQRVSPAHRLVLTLFWIDQLDHESIAEILGCPVGTVWSRLYYARAALARQLGMETE